MSLLERRGSSESYESVTVWRHLLHLPKKKKKKVFLPSLDYLQTQEVVKKGGKEVDKMFVYLKKKTCGINVCYDRTRYCI